MLIFTAKIYRKAQHALICNCTSAVSICEFHLYQTYVITNPQYAAILACVRTVARYLLTVMWKTKMK